MTKKKDRFYVYLHLNSKTQEIFYIGKGCKRRAYSTKSRTQAWLSYTHHNPFDVVIYKSNLTEDEALKLEKELLLANLTNTTLVNIVLPICKVKPVKIPKPKLWETLTKEFIEKSIKRHGDRFDYTNTKILTRKENELVSITCKHHGPFKDYARIHLYDPIGGCPLCTLPQVLGYTDEEWKVALVQLEKDAAKFFAHKEAYEKNLAVEYDD